MIYTNGMDMTSMKIPLHYSCDHSHSLLQKYIILICMNEGKNTIFFNRKLYSILSSNCTELQKPGFGLYDTGMELKRSRVIVI